MGYEVESDARCGRGLRNEEAARAAVVDVGREMVLLQRRSDIALYKNIARMAWRDLVVVKHRRRRNRDTRSFENPDQK